MPIGHSQVTPPLRSIILRPRADCHFDALISLPGLELLSSRNSFKSLLLSVLFKYRGIPSVLANRNFAFKVRVKANQISDRNDPATGGTSAELLPCKLPVVKGPNTSQKCPSWVLKDKLCFKRREWERLIVAGAMDRKGETPSKL
jgi:hypothetical protein